MLAVHYGWLFGCLPLSVAISSVLLGGFLVGALVTATHQTEEIMYEQAGQFVDIQFRSTREAEQRCEPCLHQQLAHNHLFGWLYK